MSELRACLLIAGSLLLPLAAHAHSQARSPDTCVSFDIGNPGWSNADEARTSDNDDADVDLNDNESSDALVCYDYDFAIPAGATILGIVVKVERRTSSGGSSRRDALMLLIKGGAATGTDRSTTTAYTTSDFIEDHGSATDLWGTTWTPADINDNLFGAAFGSRKDGGGGGIEQAFVDHMEIEVHYSEPPPAPSLVSPADGATEATATPTFTWSAVADPDGDAVTYDMQADNSGCGFASPEVDQSGLAGPTFTPGTAMPNATYCWRARAVDEHGLAGPWSATRNVTVSSSAALSQTASPGRCVSVNVGNPNWGNADRAETSNNSRARSDIDDDEQTDALVCDQYGFSLPADAIILGIVVSVERRTDDDTNISPTRDFLMRVMKAGVAQATDRSSTNNYTTGDEVEDHGGPNDLWGAAWTAADINDPGFGARFMAQKLGSQGGGVRVEVDHMGMTIHYTTPALVTPGSFNAFETGTAAGAITGPITTKVAGVAFSLDVVAISSGAQLAGFTNPVTVELLGNTALGIPLDAQNCPTSSTVVQTVAPDPTINAGRSTVNFAAVPNAWRDVRVRVRYPVGAPTVTSCSTDNFAIRPASFSLTATDNDWQTAGAGRALNNAAANGGAVHKAGRPFRLTVTPAPATATNYNGSPTVSALSCTLPAGCANGTLSVGAYASSGGSQVSDAATYNEAGAFNLTLVDQAYASVDSADGTPADCSGRYVCQAAAPLAVGRFVPDRFALAATIAPVYRTFDALDAACSVPPAGPRRSFTYVGQPFGYATVPAATVTAQNAGGGTTTNYRGALWKLDAASASQSIANAPVLPIDTALVGAPALTETLNTGTGTLSANAADKIAFVRDNTTPLAPFTANLALTWSVADASEAGPNQGTITTASALVFSGIVFDSGGDFRYGRLRLATAHGSQLVPLPVPVETQYWSGVAGFITNAADHCTPIDATSVAMAGFSGNLAACETAISGGGTLTVGRRALILAAPGSANDGAVTLSANLGAAAAGTTCTVVGGAATPATAADRAYLQGNWTGALYDDDPTARATFGAFKGSGEVIFMRENY